MDDFLYKDKTYQIIGILFEVHKNLGKGFSEIVYKDAIEFIMAGADLVQIGSGNFINPTISLDIIDGIEDFMEKQGIKSLSEIKGIIGRENLC